MQTLNLLTHKINYLIQLHVHVLLTSWGNEMIFTEKIEKELI
jgi:hypothetical protein